MFGICKYSLMASCTALISQDKEFYIATPPAYTHIHTNTHTYEKYTHHRLSVISLLTE